MNKRTFDIPNCKIHEWRNGKERNRRLGRGRILWIKARTLSGKTINIVNVYQATADKPEMQKRMYETLTRAFNSEHDPCILVGDFNVSIEAKGKILTPDQDSWRNPFGGIRSREAKLDFVVTYNFEEAETKGYVDWISMLHDHVRVGFAIGDSLWEGAQYTPRPTPKPGNPSNGKRLKITQMLPVVKEVNEECASMAEGLLKDPDVSQDLT